MNRRLSTTRCLDCGTTQQSCEGTREIDRRACCDRCEHADALEPDTSRLKAQP